jgi:hypothetical protein
MEDIYVLVADNDLAMDTLGVKWADSKGPIVFEQYTNSASLKEIQERIQLLDGRYGRCRIAKLEFIEPTSNTPN